MSNYVKSTNFAIKDSLVTTDPAKIIKGTDIDNEYNAIANAISSKADTNSPSLTGTPAAPTATYGANTTQLANTSFVAAGLAGLVPAGIITLWSGAISAIPTGWVLCNGANSTPDLRDRFVVGAGSSYAVGATGGAASVTLDATMIPSHTHTVSASGTTSAVSNDHTHTFSGTSSGQSNTHSHGVSDPGHAHGFSNNIIAQGNTGQQGRTDGSQASVLTATAAATTGISIGNASADHSHTYSGTTSGISANHTHTVTVSGTTGNGTGGGLGHENRPPYYALAYIMKT